MGDEMQIWLVTFRQLHSQFLGCGERQHGHLPGRGSVDLANVPDRSEPPQRPLPARDRGRYLRGWRTCTPLLSHQIENERWPAVPQHCAKSAEVFLIKAGRYAFIPSCGNVFLQGQNAPAVGVELDTLQVHRSAAAGHRELRIELTDASQCLIRPIPRRGRWRKSNAFRCQHRMARNLFGRIQILG